MSSIRPFTFSNNFFSYQVYSPYQSGMFSSVIDTRMGSHPLNCIDQFLKLALSCCQEKGHGRPSMADVVWELKICHIILDSDRGSSVPSTPVPRRKSNDIPTTTLSLDHTCAITDVSGSNLISGVIPTIRPL